MRGGFNRKIVGTGSAPVRQTDFFEYVLSRFDQLGAVAYQLVATLGQR
jgi:hypothetical protein